MKTTSEPLLIYGNLQRLLFVLCGGGWGIAMAIEVSLGITLNEVGQEWNLSYLELSFVSSFTMVGIFIGSYFWGLLADKKGRKPAFDKLLIPILIGVSIAALSVNIWMLALSYILVGFGIGGSFTVDGNVFLEYCPVEKQYMLTSISVLSSVGSSLPAAFALFYEGVHAPYQWRLIQASLAAITLAIAVPRFWIKETPGFLISKHRTDEVVILLQRINGKSEDFQSVYDKVLEASPVDKAEERKANSQIAALFRKPLRKFTLLYLIIWPLTSFTFIGVVSFLPVILIRAGVGKNDKDLYEILLYQQLGIIYSAGIPGVILGTYLVKSRLGRKGTLILSQVVAVLLFFGFLIENYWAVI